MEMVEKNVTLQSKIVAKHPFMLFCFDTSKRKDVFLCQKLI